MWHLVGAIKLVRERNAGNIGYLSPTRTAAWALMKISVICESCGQRLSVPEALAGRQGKCPQCRYPIKIPVPGQESELGSADAGYGLEDPPEAPVAYKAPEATSFVRTVGRETSDPSHRPERRSKRPKRPRKARSRERGIDWNAPGTRKALLLALGMVGALAIVALFVPRMMIIVGSILALAGLILTLYGYITAIYIAFTEDDLHGWLVLIFPFYAAYYLVSRWDEMKSRLIIILIGMALSAVGSWMIETGRARSRPADSDQAEVAMSEVESSSYALFGRRLG